MAILLTWMGVLLPRATEFGALDKKAVGRPDLAEMIREIDRTREAAFAFAVEALGAKVPEGAKVAVTIRDASDLEWKTGDGALRRLEARLQAGADYRDALAAVAGKKYPEFRMTGPRR